MDSIGYLGIFVALIGLVGGAWSVFAHLKAKARASAAERWPVADGRILESNIELRTGGSGRSRYAHYAPAIRYAYSAAGREREGRTIRFGLVTTNTRKGAEAILAPYPVGSTTQVRYNPENADESVLDFGKVGKNLIVSAVVCAAVLAIGLLIIALAVRGTFSSDIEGRWHAHFEIDGYSYEGEIDVHRNAGTMTVSWSNGAGEQRQAREQCSFRRDKQRVIVGCRDPQVVQGQGTYSADNFDLTFVNARTLQGSISSQNGASAGSAVFSRR